MLAIFTFSLVFSVTSSVPVRDTVLVYNDTGVASSCFEDTCLFFTQRNYTVIPVDAYYLIRGNWDISPQSTILVFPGGADSSYHTKLMGQGCANIRLFVHQGGFFVGVCAGSYFSSKWIEYAVGTPDEITGYRELGFFPGIARGPVLNPYDYTSESGASAARLHLSDGTQLFVYHNGGPTFVSLTGEYPNVEILATYDDVNNQPAILRCSYGKGTALLSGVHFERQLSRMSDDIQTAVESTLQDLNSFLAYFFPVVMPL